MFEICAKRYKQKMLMFDRSLKKARRDGVVHANVCFVSLKCFSWFVLSTLTEFARYEEKEADSETCDWLKLESHPFLL